MCFRPLPFLSYFNPLALPSRLRLPSIKVIFPILEYPTQYPDPSPVFLCLVLSIISLPCHASISDLSLPCRVCLCVSLSIFEVAAGQLGQGKCACGYYKQLASREMDRERMGEWGWRGETSGCTVLPSAHAEGTKFNLICLTTFKFMI